MKKQDHREIKEGQESLTDLPLTTEQATETKAGADSVGKCQVTDFYFVKKID